MKTKNTSILPMALLTAALLGLMIASGSVMSTATAQSNTTTISSTNATPRTKPIWDLVGTDFLAAAIQTFSNWRALPIR